MIPTNIAYNLASLVEKYIRPQGVENRASRPLSRTQATRREVSSWVGDHQRIPSVVCILLFIFDILFSTLFSIRMLLLEAHVSFCPVETLTEDVTCRVSRRCPCSVPRY
ncbi:hypothetical protein ASPBRDRAFT_482066 [Aspergillus brasiliensis CBS 101740]|uniref:Uncharacterized protein n=1 Tax=Aspergillus brasiliensis (strain CBS 101740 / IMI 381727 / IBT 21946) TaxID=767769 RepID=A0A1L9UU65_ASPBC|nr:hypothetical protein ASPBRDRAFT_482066 [Aspergillus brasiliensis CBS 101740]